MWELKLSAAVFNICWLFLSSLYPSNPLYIHVLDPSGECIPELRLKGHQKEGYVTSLSDFVKLFLAKYSVQCSPPTSVNGGV